MQNNVNEHQEQVKSICHDLDEMFYEGRKVMNDPGLAMSYVDWALREGYSSKDIRNSFEVGLESCHVDATDERLRRNDHNFKYELTSTIYRAKERLNKKCKKIENNKENMETNKEKSMYRRNPEIDEKIDAFMQENPRLVDFYEKIDRSELVRKACLQAMKREEWKKRQELQSANNQSIESPKKISMAV